MTVAAASRKILFPNISGSTGPFPFTFRVLVEVNGKPDILVTKINGASRTVLNWPGDYSFATTTLGLSGGGITLAVAGVANDSLLIEGATPIDQPIKYANLARFFPEVHEVSYDKLTLIVQELAQVLDAALTFPAEDSSLLTSTTPNATGRAGKILGFDTSGNVVAVQSIGLWRGVWATSINYNFGDIVQDGAAGANTTNYYYSNVAHTSGVWATDLAAGKWTKIIDIAVITAAQAAAAASAVAAANSATASSDASKLTLVTDATTARTIGLTDQNKQIDFTSGSAIICTIPKNSVIAFPIGCQLVLNQAGAGQITVTPVDGTVTLRSKFSRLKSEATQGKIYLLKTGTDQWDLVGDLAP